MTTDDERQAVLNAELAAIEAYRQAHLTCHIQNHPWTAVFGAGFDAGCAYERARCQAAPAPATTEVTRTDGT
jgi:hypothetical protein